MSPIEWPFGLEPFGVELWAERLRAERGISPQDIRLNLIP